VDVGLFGTYGSKDEHFSFDDEDRYWNAGAALTLPLYTGGRTVLGIDVARDTERQADNDIVQVRRSVRRGIVDADAGATLALRQYAAAVKAVTASEENLRVTRLKYNQGLISNIDVIDALLSLSRSQFDRIQALKDFHINRARLMRLAGTIEELP
jgi:outer membrane protein TolC